MNARRTLLLAAVAILIATAALAFALVATVRAGDEADSPPQDPAATSMPGHSRGAGVSFPPDMEHGAAAPQDGVRNATAAHGGRPLARTTDDDTCVFRLTAKASNGRSCPASSSPPGPTTARCPARRSGSHTGRRCASS
jgi:hypothetical protein